MIYLTTIMIIEISAMIATNRLFYTDKEKSTIHPIIGRWIIQKLKV